MKINKSEIQQQEGSFYENKSPSGSKITEIIAENIISDDVMINEILGEEDGLAEIIATIEPASGGGVLSQNLNDAGAINSGANFQIQTVDQLVIQSTDSSGILEETELKYGVEYTSLSNVSLFTNFQSLVLNGNFQNENKIVFDVDTPIFSQADIILSNATRDQKYINATHSYELKAKEVGVTHKIFGREMDINSVSDDVRVDYIFKTQDSVRAILKSGWNSLKNIELNSDDLNAVTLKNFVHTDVSLSGNADKNVKIYDAKRGSVETEDGNDKVFVKALSNGAGWSNSFDIQSGAGDDVITVKGSHGHTIAHINAGAGDDRVTLRDHYDYADVDLGDGDDRFQKGTGDDYVRGGLGNDRLLGGAGNDVLYGGDARLPTAMSYATQLDFEFVKSQAGYKNTVGFYTVSNTGTIQNVKIIFENLKDMSFGDIKTFEIDADLGNVKTFIIANGYNANGQYQNIDTENAVFDFVYNRGQVDERAASVTDDADAVSLVYNNAQHGVLINGHVFHDIQSLNRDGGEHTIATVLGDKTQIAYEDLYNLGDRDYTDAVFNVEQNVLYNFSYDDVGDDADVIKGGTGHDILVGGDGNDRLYGDAGIDIAVFMGRVEEYRISQHKNGNVVIQDTVEGRDGIDIVSGVEGILFGIEELYASIMSGGNNSQEESTFSDKSVNNLDLSDFLEEYSPIQGAIDSFVSHAEQGQFETVKVGGDVASLTIFTNDDAIINSHYDVI